MYKILIAALVVVLFAFGIVGESYSANGTVAANYSATGTWEGSFINIVNSSDRLKVRLILEDDNGKLSGRYYFYDGYWKYLGELNGERSRNSATGIIPNPIGYIMIIGTFSGNSFSGLSYMNLNSGERLAGYLFLRRNSLQNTAQVPTNSTEN